MSITLIVVCYRLKNKLLHQEYQKLVVEEKEECKKNLAHSAHVIWIAKLPTMLRTVFPRQSSGKIGIKWKFYEKNFKTLHILLEPIWKIFRCTIYARINFTLPITLFLMEMLENVIKLHFQVSNLNSETLFHTNYNFHKSCLISHFWKLKEKKYP